MTTYADRLYQMGGSPVGGDLLGLLGKGKVRFLDPNGGIDGASGKTAERAWKTLQYAADQCGYRRANGDAEGSQDIIIRLPGVEEVTAEIAFDGNYGGTGYQGGANIAVVAATAGQRIFGDVLGCHTRAGAGYTTGNLIGVYYRAVSFYGLSFGNRGTGSQSDGSDACISYRTDTSDAGIQTAGGGQFAMVRNCNFRDDGGLNTTGIYYFGSGGLLAYQNQFGYYNDTRGPIGITIRGSGTNNPFDIRIKENYFHTCPVGIQCLAATMTGGFIVENNIFQGNTLGLRFAAAFNNTKPGFIMKNTFSTTTGTESWINDGPNTDSVAHVLTDCNIEFSNNTYSDDDSGA